MRTELPKEWYINPKNKYKDEVLCEWRGGGHKNHY
jgi:hypothetical protein